MPLFLEQRAQTQQLSKYTGMWAERGKKGSLTEFRAREVFKNWPRGCFLWGTRGFTFHRCALWGEPFSAFTWALHWRCRCSHNHVGCGVCLLFYSQRPPPPPPLFSSPTFPLPLPHFLSLSPARPVAYPLPSLSLSLPPFPHSPFLQFTPHSFFTLFSLSFCYFCYFLWFHHWGNFIRSSHRFL